MPDPAEIAVISSVLPAVTTFLLSRVERLLGPRGAEPEDEVTVPDGLVGTIGVPLHPDEHQLALHRTELELLRDGLAAYARGDIPVSTADQALLRNLARLRAALENIYSQYLTFAGEARPASGPYVRQNLTTVSGQAIGMDADEITGNSRVVQDAQSVAPGATLTGMKARRIGPQ
ncbi:hypothetical protein ACIQRE_00190 [Streptomyces griseoluteus]|uniref:hypothetical protein n=1 Tax=Streptomyces griseoluteus TaxID=29306 RepID=UPI00382E7BF1